MAVLGLWAEILTTPPQDIQKEMKQWLKDIGGDVCAPGNITCKSAGGGRVIDFFIVDSRISHGVKGVWMQMDFPSSPHYLVVLRMEQTATLSEISNIILPKSFEPRPLIGCQRKLVDEGNCQADIADMNEHTVSTTFEKLVGISEKASLPHV